MQNHHVMSTIYQRVEFAIMLGKKPHHLCMHHNAILPLFLDAKGEATKQLSSLLDLPHPTPPTILTAPKTTYYPRPASRTARTPSPLSPRLLRISRM